MQGRALKISSMNHPMLRMNKFRLHYRPATTTNFEFCAPSTTFARFASSSGSPPPLRGGGWCERSRSRDALAPEVCRPKPPSFCLQKNKGRRSAEKAQLSRGASPRAQMLPPKRASGGAARSAERARLSALHRGSCFGTQAPQLSPGRASRDAVRRRYLRLGIALKRSTSRAGRNAGGVDARTAREQK
jgi:hypothetical protein